MNAASPSITFGFVGRLARDKGMAELATAWGRVRDEAWGSQLLIVGPDIEPWNAASHRMLLQLRADERVEFTGPRDDVENLYARMDILVLPSHREGFPNVALEAAAMELPVVTTDALGCRDAVVDGETGIIVPVRNTEALSEAVLRLARDPELRARMGAAGRKRAIRDFNPDTIVAELMDLYAGKGGP